MRIDSAGLAKTVAGKVREGMKNDISFFREVREKEFDGCRRWE
jgi:hypothetical protein